MKTKIKFSALSAKLQTQIRKELAAENKAFQHTQKALDKLSLALTEVERTFKSDLSNYARINLSLFKDPAAADAYVKEQLRTLEPLFEAVKDFGTEEVFFSEPY